MRRPGSPRLLLEIDLTRPVVEVEPDDLPGRLRARQAVRWRRLLAAVRDTAGSPQVAGVVATIGTGLSLAAVQELAAAIAAVHDAGKPTLAWAESYGEAGDGATAYTLAAAFAEVWLQPSGMVGLTGVASEVTFLRGVLDRVGIEPQLGQRKEYKSAADRITRDAFTPAHEEMVRRLTDSTYEQVLGAVTAGRGLTADSVGAAVDAGPLTADEALARGLVDRLGYRDEAYAAVRARCGDVRLRYAEHWQRPVPAARRATRVVTRPAAVALVDVAGAITQGRSRRGLSGTSAGSTTIAGQLRAAAGDRRVAAVVLRVDSPGGSAVASDTIWHEVRRVREAGKPVVVSMGTLAASGGYYVACGADHVVADPATLTGSIGVVGGKAVVSGLLERVGVTTGTVERGQHAGMFSARRRFTEEEWEHAERWLDAVYADFVAKVAEGRRMPVDAVEQVARGRVWTGADALDLGLVDRLGGLHVAVDEARDRAGLRPDAPVRPAVQLPLPARLRAPRSSEDPRAGVGSLGAQPPLSALAGTSAGLPGAGPGGRLAALAEVALTAVGLVAGPGALTGVGALTMTDVGLIL